MNDVFKKRQLSFLLKLGLFTLLVGGVHLYIYQNFFSASYTFFPIWHIYLFHFVTVLLIYSVINYKFSNGVTVVLNYFMAGTLIKMILAFVFLLPLLLSDFESKRLDVVNFFIPYFFFLAFEVFSVNFFLNKAE